MQQYNPQSEHIHNHIHDHKCTYNTTRRQQTNAAAACWSRFLFRRCALFSAVLFHKQFLFRAGHGCMQQHVHRILGVGGAFDEMAVYVPGATSAKGGGQQRRTIISMISTFISMSKIMSMPNDFNRERKDDGECQTG